MGIQAGVPQVPGIQSLRVPEGQVRLDWYRRGRYIGFRIGMANGQVRETKIPLVDLVKSGNITRQELEAVADEAEAIETVDHIDRKYNPELVDMRINALPENCQGKTVLDVGGYDGEIALECLKRGATSAIVYDNGEWSDYSWSRPIVKPGCVYQRGDIMNFGAIAPKPADIVLLYNVIYHTRDPWTMLERCRLLTRETFVICTSFVPGEEPMWKILGRNEDDFKINDTHTLFWKPTLNGLRRLLELAGFEIQKEEGPVGDHICIRCS